MKERDSSEGRTEGFRNLQPRVSGLGNDVSFLFVIGNGQHRCLVGLFISWRKGKVKKYRDDAVAMCHYAVGLT